MIKLDDAQLDAWFGTPLADLNPDRAFALVTELAGLARWWLRPEVLQLARDFASLLPPHHRRQWDELTDCELPEGIGTCWPIFVNTRPQQLPLLRSAVIFPLRWENREDHDERLPANVTLLADEIRSQASQAQENVGDLRLAPAVPSMLGNCDLSELNFKCESAWASLAGGLILACRNGRPSRNVWVSAQWRKGRGLEPVSGLADKIELVREVGGTRLFVAHQQALDATSMIPLEHATPEIESLSEAAAPDRPLEALRSYMKKHWLMPTRQSSQEERANYFLYFDSAKAARPWYFEHCLPDVIEGLKQKLASRPLLKEVKYLVIDLSPFPEQIALSVAVLRPIRCALIVDERMRGRVEEAKQLIAKVVPCTECTVRPYDSNGRSVDELLGEYRKILDTFTRGMVDPRQLIVDISPGYKHCNHTMLRAAPAGCQAIYFSGDFDQHTRRIIPFTDWAETWINKSEG